MEDFELDTFPDVNPTKLRMLGYKAIEWAGRCLGIPPPNKLDLRFREENLPQVVEVTD